MILRPCNFFNQLFQITQQFRLQSFHCVPSVFHQMQIARQTLAVQKEIIGTGLKRV